MSVMTTCQYDLLKVRHSLVLSRRDGSGYVESVIVPYRGVAGLTSRVSKTDDGLRWSVRVHVVGMNDDTFLLGPFVSSDEAGRVVQEIASASWRPDNY